MNKAAIRILTVDDDPGVRQLIRLTLAQAGYRIETAGSLAEARAHMRARSYHLLIVDLVLPDGSGLDLAATAGIGQGGPPVIIVTGRPSVDSAAEGMQRGARNYLTKPVSPDVLVEAVETVLGEEGWLIGSEEQFLAELGRRLKAARLRADLTMRALADRIGVSQAQISQIEAGLSAASVATLFHLARALNLELSELMSGF